MKYLLISLLFATTLTGCKVAFNPSADTAIKERVEHVSILKDALYLEIAAVPDKSYTPFIPKYSAINAEINSLVLLNSYRLHSTSFQTMIGNVQINFLKYESEHKAKGSITSNEAKIYSSYMDGWLKPLLQSENLLK